MRWLSLSALLSAAAAQERLWPGPTAAQDNRGKLPFLHSPAFPDSYGACCARCASKGSQITAYDLRFKSWSSSNCSCFTEAQHGARFAVDECSRELMPRRVVLGISTGHAGTKTLSNKHAASVNPFLDLTEMACYTETAAGPPIVWNFEETHIYGDRAEVGESGLKSWYATLRNASDYEEAQEAERLVRLEILPDMLVYAHRMLAAKVGSDETLDDATYVDLGHQSNLGLLQPLITELEADDRVEQVSAVRVIRNRYDTVRSFASEWKVPCSEGGPNGMFSLCPTMHKVELIPPEGAWEQLDSDQRLFWFIDEVEARWQRVLQMTPELDYLSVSWCEHDDFKAVWDATAEFIGEGSLAASNCTSPAHEAAHTGRQATDAELSEKDAAYYRLMGFDKDPYNAARVLATQQASICHPAKRGRSGLKRGAGKRKKHARRLGKHKHHAHKHKRGGSELKAAHEADKRLLTPRDM